LVRPRPKGVTGGEDGVAILAHTIEAVFSILRRGMIGVYQHCGEAHLHRYLAEFDFRYNRRTAPKITDAERHDDLLSMIGGKRLTYRRIGEAAHAYVGGAKAFPNKKKEEMTGWLEWPALRFRVLPSIHLPTLRLGE